MYNPPFQGVSRVHIISSMDYYYWPMICKQHFNVVSGMLELNLYTFSFIYYNMHHIVFFVSKILICKVTSEA